jgi:hypothetical protein
MYNVVIKLHIAWGRKKEKKKICSSLYHNCEDKKISNTWYSNLNMKKLFRLWAVALLSACVQAEQGNDGSCLLFQLFSTFHPSIHPSINPSIHPSIHP